jgi:hypothetical protein
MSSYYLIIFMIKTLRTYPAIIILFSSLILIIPGNISAQSCGFGCLGLSGVFGGYTFQEFKAGGINSWIKDNSITGTNYDFNKGQGFRFGTNLFRAKFDKYFITAKGFYQFINEEYKSTSMIEIPKEKFELKHNYWGVGLDFGIPLFSVLDWKIIEGGVTFLNVELKATQTNADNQIVESKIENTKLDLGYYLASGLVIHIVRDYISLEGTVAYNRYEVNEFMDHDGESLAIENGESFIESKGITTTVQLNLGFPL